MPSPNLKNTTNYIHPDEPNLLDLHKSMAYTADGAPALRVLSNIQGDITIEGTVNIPGTVTVGNFPATQTVNGTVNIGTLPNISGSVNVNNFPATQTVSGTVNIGTMPEVEIRNDLGNPVPVRWDYTAGSTIIPWDVQVARGKIDGVEGLSISGYSPSVGTTFIPAWLDGPYVYFETAQVVRVWSESAADTDVSVLIEGLDANYEPLTETVVLTNGITGVLTSNQFFRINKIRLTRTPQNQGTIHAGSSDKTITLAYISTVAIGNGAGVSQMTVYTVPAGYTFYLTQSNWYIAGNQPARYRSWTRGPNGVVNIILTFPILSEYNSVKIVSRPYPARTDIQWQVSATNNVAVGGQIEGYLIRNDVL